MACSSVPSPQTHGAVASTCCTTVGTRTRSNMAPHQQLVHFATPQMIHFSVLAYDTFDSTCGKITSHICPTPSLQSPSFIFCVSTNYFTQISLTFPLIGSIPICPSQMQRPSLSFEISASEQTALYRSIGSTITISRIGIQTTQLILNFFKLLSIHSTRMIHPRSPLCRLNWLPSLRTHPATTGQISTNTQYGIYASHAELQPSRQIAV